MEAVRRKALLEALVGCLEPERDVESLTTFLPLRRHEEMLHDHIVVIVGERGTGKTALFRFLAALEDRRIPLGQVFPRAPDGHRVWLEGFEEHGTAHPGTQALASWATDAPDLRLEQFWLGHLVAHLVRALREQVSLRFLEPWRRHRNELGCWVPLVEPEIGPIYGWLDDLDRRLRAASKTVVIGYDDLDRVLLGGGLELPARVSAALIGLWLRLTRRYGGLRGKILLRPDLFARTRVSTTDASKLRGHTAALEWSAEDVFRVLLRRIVANESLRGWLGEPGGRFKSEKHPHLGWMPPIALPEGPAQLDLWPPPEPVVVEAAEPTQKAFATLLAGPTMGTGVKKGHTHRWILNHTRDGLGQSLPRVTLNLIRNAARSALERGGAGNGETLLTPSDLEWAQGPTGEQRLDELREAHPIVGRLESMRAQTVPMDPAEAQRLLAQPNPSHPDQERVDGQTAFERLAELGVLLHRSPKQGEEVSRADMPDLFRRPLGIQRKGGPLQIRPRS